MFKEEYIDNDLEEVDNTICEYYGIEKYGLTRKVKDTSKFSILEKKEIKYKLINRTESITDISKKIGINRRTAGRIINELIWKEIVL